MPPLGRGLPGFRVVLVATALVVGVAELEVRAVGHIGSWTGVALLTVSIVASLVTRHGDRSLPAMMPPLAFLAAALIAGQEFTDPGSTDLLARQAEMLVEVLGSNSIWVVVSTAGSVSICTVLHFYDRRREKRAVRERAQLAT